MISVNMSQAKKCFELPPSFGSFKDVAEMLKSVGTYSAVGTYPGLMNARMRESRNLGTIL